MVKSAAAAAVSPDLCCKNEHQLWRTMWSCIGGGIKGERFSVVTCCVSEKSAFYPDNVQSDIELDSLEANSIALPRSRNDSQIHSGQHFWPGAIRLKCPKSCRKSFRDGNLSNLLKGHVQTVMCVRYINCSSETRNDSQMDFRQRFWL